MIKLTMVALALTLAAGTAHAANGHDGLSRSHELNGLGGMARSLVTRFAGNGSSGSTHTTLSGNVTSNYMEIHAARAKAASLRVPGRVETSLVKTRWNPKGFYEAKVYVRSVRDGGVNLGPTSTFRGHTINLDPNAENPCTLC